MTACGQTHAFSECSVQLQSFGQVLCKAQTCWLGNVAINTPGRKFVRAKLRWATLEGESVLGQPAAWTCCRVTCRDRRILDHLQLPHPGGAGSALMLILWEPVQAGAWGAWCGHVCQGVDSLARWPRDRVPPASWPHQTPHAHQHRASNCRTTCRLGLEMPGNCIMSLPPVHTSPGARFAGDVL